MHSEIRNIIYAFVIEEGFTRTTRSTAAALDAQRQSFLHAKEASNHLYMPGSRVECLWLASSLLRKEYKPVVLARIGQSTCLVAKGQEDRQLHGLFRGCAHLFCTGEFTMYYKTSAEYLALYGRN